MLSAHSIRGMIAACLAACAVSGANATTSGLEHIPSPSGDLLVSWLIGGSSLTFFDVAQARVTATYNAGAPIGWLQFSLSERFVCIEFEPAEGHSHVIVVDRGNAFHKVVDLSGSGMTSVRCDANTPAVPTYLRTPLGTQPNEIVPITVVTSTICNSETQQTTTNTTTEYWGVAKSPPKIIRQFTVTDSRCED